MASLKGLLTNRNPAEMIEENLETGYIYVWSPGTNYTNFCNGVCWKAPAAGTAHIEIWGAGGSGARMCCCGDGLPGNACLLYTSPSPRDSGQSRMPSSA